MEMQQIPLCDGVPYSTVRNQKVERALMASIAVSQLDRLAGLDVCQFGFLETP
jgi:hypothetical protein